MTRANSWTWRLTAFFKWNAVCMLNVYIFSFRYFQSEKSIGVRMAEICGHENVKWNKITLSLNCCDKHFTEDNVLRSIMLHHTKADRAFHYWTFGITKLVTFLDSKHYLAYTFVDRQYLLQKWKAEGQGAFHKATQCHFFRSYHEAYRLFSALESSN